MQMQYAGILLNSALYRGITIGRTGTEALGHYVEAARKYGVIPCFLRLEDIHPTKRHCVAQVPVDGGYQRMLVPVPTVIHNRAMYKHRRSWQRLEALRRRGVHIFNGYTRFNKYDVHQLLTRDRSLLPHLPATHKASSASITKLLEEHGDVVLKPCNGSIGKGIMRLYKGREYWMMQYRERAGERKWLNAPLLNGQLPYWMLQRMHSQAYIVQQTVPLAQYHGRPFDIRVTVQRGYGGSWGITGMFAKVAPPNSFVSNVGQGGSAIRVEEALAFNFPPYQVRLLLSRLEMLAIRIAQSLASSLVHSGPLSPLADVGLDLGVDQRGELHFIECNGRDQRYGFREAGMPEIWQETYDKPVAYASWVLHQLALKRM
ncbi:YheC/YheD family protein [Paenibacillus massiliensis]|uniref:YheC/YheD family endospore coat-associated protein n=1 Tax=Paenibacillus massiliensis TaxID=225917 RepID=UPI0004B80A35|nr:YheC/YheD family protein [Paenibacillus massiliensis]